MKTPKGITIPLCRKCGLIPSEVLMVRKPTFPPVNGYMVVLTVTCCEQRCCITHSSSGHKYESFDGPAYEAELISKKLAIEEARRA